MNKLLLLIGATLMTASVATASPKGCDNRGYYNGPNGCNNKSCFKGKKRAGFIKNIRYALKHVGLKSGDWGDFKIAMKHFRQTMRATKPTNISTFFSKGKFDSKKFIKNHRSHTRIAAQVELMETVLLILDTEQKKKFIMLLGANQQFMKYRQCNQHKKGCPNRRNCD